MLAAGISLLPSSAFAAGFEFKETFGSAAQPSFTNPAGMAVDQSTGDLYVIDLENKTLSRFNEDGTADNFSALTSTNVIDGHAGEADATPQEQILGNFGPAEAEVAIDNSGGPNDGDIYVTDSVNHVIDIFAPTGAFLAQLTESTAGTFGETCGVAVGPDGSVYVGDFNGEVHKFADPPVNGASTDFTAPLPCQLAAGAGPSEGFIFVNEWAPFSEGHILKLDDETGALEYIVSTDSNTTLGVDPASGHVYGVLSAAGEIKEFDASGATEATEVSSTALASFGQGVAVNGSTANLYATRTGNPNVEVFAPGAPTGVPPTVTGVSPNKGSTLGGQTVTITGTELEGATSVKFGTEAATTFSVESGTEIKATTPPGSEGTVDVTVKTPGGTSATSPADEYTYVSPPAVSSVAPNKGPTTGGQVVTLTGAHFTEASKVSFGGSDVTCDGTVVHCKVEGGTEIKATTPPGAAGTVDVTVTSPYGTSATSVADHYTYVEAPSVTSISPTQGPLGAGTVIEITGANLAEATEVKFGPSAVTGGAITENTATKIKFTAPACSAGVQDIRVLTAGGESANTAADDFTCIAAPTVTNLSPNQGPTAGGNTVEITGTDLAETTKVEFGTTSVACPSAQCTIESNTLVEVVAPPHTGGTVHVTVTAFGGTSTNTAADEYIFSFLPFVISLEPTQGSIAGGNTVKITGVNLSGATEVEIGGNVVTAPFAANTATKIEFTAPAHAAGTVDVRITTPGGISPNSTADDYAYIGPPTVTTTAGASALVQTTATVAGSVNPNGGNVTGCRVEYGLTAAYGAEANCASLPGSGSSPVGVSAALGGLSASTTYHFRFKASNVGGTGTGSDQTFATLADTCATKSSLCPPPSNKAKPISAKSQGENVLLKIEVPGPGSLAATGKKMKKAVANPAGAGLVKLTLKLTSAGKKQLRTKGKLKVKVTIAFTPVGGTPGKTKVAAVFKAKKR